MSKTPKLVIIVSIVVVVVLASATAAVVLCGNTVRSLLEQWNDRQSNSIFDAPTTDPYDYEIMIIPSQADRNGEYLLAAEMQTRAVKALLEQRLPEMHINDFQITPTEDSSALLLQIYKPVEDVDVLAVLEQLADASSRQLAFYKDKLVETGLPTAPAAGAQPIITSRHLLSATVGEDTSSDEFVVSITLNEEGTRALEQATTELSELNQASSSYCHTISVWIGDTCIANPTVTTPITETPINISGSFSSYEEARDFVNLLYASLVSYKIVDTTEH